MPSFYSVSGASVSGNGQLSVAIAVVSSAAMAVPASARKSSVLVPPASATLVEVPTARKRATIAAIQQAADVVDGGLIKSQALAAAESAGQAGEMTSSRAASLAPIATDTLPATIAALRQVPVSVVAIASRQVDGQGAKLAGHSAITCHSSPAIVGASKGQSLPIVGSSCLPATIAALKQISTAPAAAGSAAIPGASKKEHTAATITCDASARDMQSRKATSVEYSSSSIEPIEGTSRKSATGLIPHSVGHVIVPTVQKDDLFGGIVFSRPRRRVTCTPGVLRITHLASRRVAIARTQPTIAAASSRRVALLATSPRIAGSD